MTRCALVALSVLVPVLVPAMAAAKYQGRIQEDPIAIAIVFDTRRPVTDALRVALDKIDLDSFDDFGRGFPRGSQVVLVGYDTGARIVASFGPLDALSGRALPAVEPHGGTDVVAGVETAIAELARSYLERRAIIVVGDNGSDLAALERPARDAGIYLHPVSVQPDLVELLDATIRAVRHEPRLLPYAPDPPPRPHETEVPWWWLGFAAAIAVAALLFARPLRGDAA